MDQKNSDKPQFDEMDGALDYRNVESIGHARIMASINQFTERTVDFLNRFSNICDMKLLEVSQRINNIEILTKILESKLESVKGLGFVPGQPLPPSSAPSPQAGVPQPPAADGAPAPLPPPPPPGAGADGQAPPPPPPPDGAAPPAEGEAVADGEGQAAEGENAEPEADPNDVRNDPRYAPYLKYLKIRVPLIAFRQKMIDEGLDPTLLENLAPQ